MVNNIKFIRNCKILVYLKNERKNRLIKREFKQNILFEENKIHLYKGMTQRALKYKDFVSNYDDEKLGLCKECNLTFN